MPELPEVEVLARHLAPRVKGQTVRAVRVRDARSVRGISPGRFVAALKGARFGTVERRGKWLVLKLTRHRDQFPLLAHLGMTGRLHLIEPGQPLPRHANVVFDLREQRLVFQDPRRFGGLTLNAAILDRLGPEPLSADFTVTHLAACCGESRQAIKPRLLDQRWVAGLGNIHLTEALFRAGIHPARPAGGLSRPEIRRLHGAVRRVLRDAIRFGTGQTLDFGEGRGNDNLFYFGGSGNAARARPEQFLAYDRAGERCPRCAGQIRRVVVGGRSSFFCPHCQPSE